MFAITAVTGKVGGTTARALINAGHKVRAIVRDRAKGAEWERLGAEVAVATFDDADVLTRAFEGTEGVFVMASPNFAPDPGFPGARKDAAAQAAAIQRARPGKVVMLSSIGGQRTSGLGLITQVHAGRGAGAADHADCHSAAGLVHGEFVVGYRTGTRNR